jgi:hypothetical protein
MAGRDPTRIIAAFAVLQLAWGFRRVWLERSQRKTTLAVLDKLLAWDRKRRQE